MRTGLGKVATRLTGRGAAASQPDDVAALRQAAAARHDRQLAGPPEPPPVPPAWTTGPPDFVGLGSQKCGTTWWFSLLCLHPGVVDPGRKELHFFQHAWDAELTDEHVAAYHRLFPRPAGQVVGEWTPRYLLDAWTPARLRRAAPDARLLVLVRDPIERFRSGVTHSLARHGRLHPRFLVEAVERGRYQTQLERVLRSFPRDQVLVQQLERCSRQPGDELARTQGFLGLERDLPPLERLTEKVYAAKQPRVQLPSDLHDELLRTYERDVVALADAWPELDVGLWPNFAHLT